ncbi:dead end protein 1-like isoform X2 [Syngnathoides biaculeatus]|uniref:dead end protein 1-like isoform X2 n=1 Tax=Syngnathoides biaculeatus TaxID=300417 RepID=UPI002ADE52E9|nr:dead end protein 1-like isoform X2 [Syngnathoides biaculeatus]
MESISSQRFQALEKWLQTTKTKITQVNGQRRYGGPPEVWIGPPPRSNCEVYIKDIPRDCYEDVLIPLFCSVGPLWEFRLMMNFSGQNRGFAYAKYGPPCVAKNAIQQLHGHMLKPASQIHVSRSKEKRKLLITDLPAFTQRDELLQLLQRLIEGVETLSMISENRREDLTAQLVFSFHRAASMAKRVLGEDITEDLCTKKEEPQPPHIKEEMEHKEIHQIKEEEHLNGIKKAEEELHPDIREEDEEDITKFPSMMSL